MNYIDTMMTKVLGWTDQIISFIMEFKLIFVIGFLAMMVSKFAKFNLKLK